MALVTPSSLSLSSLNKFATEGCIVWSKKMVRTAEQGHQRSGTSLNNKSTTDTLCAQRYHRTVRSRISHITSIEASLSFIRSQSIMHRVLIMRTPTGLEASRMHSNTKGFQLNFSAEWIIMPLLSGATYSSYRISIRTQDICDRRIDKVSVPSISQ